MITIDSPLDAVQGPKPKRSNSVCICGHSEARHEFPPRGSVCLGARESCECTLMELVLEAGDARVFMYSPNGAAHPLVAGMVSLRTRGKEWSWKPGWGRCQHPGCSNDMKTAVYNEDKTRTQLRCEEHA